MMLCHFSYEIFHAGILLWCQPFWINPSLNVVKTTKKLCLVICQTDSFCLNRQFFTRINCNVVNPLCCPQKSGYMRLRSEKLQWINVTPKESQTLTKKSLYLCLSHFCGFDFPPRVSAQTEKICCSVQNCKLQCRPRSGFYRSQHFKCLPTKKHLIAVCFNHTDKWKSGKFKRIMIMSRDMQEQKAFFLTTFY